MVRQRKKMTLIIAAKTKDSIIIGADSRAVQEDRAGTRIINDAAEKLVQLNKHSCILMAGDSQPGTYLIEEFKKRIGKKNKDIITISRELSEFCRKEYKPYIDYGGSNKTPNVSFILVGLEKNGTPRIFLISSYNSFFIGEEKQYAIIGKDNISNYLFAKLYKKSCDSSENMTKLIVQCLYDTEKIDGDSGGKMHVGTITKKYGFVETGVDSYVNDIENNDLIKLIEK